MRPVICKVCGEPFAKQRIGQKTCSVKCAIEYAKKDTEKKAKATARLDRKITKERLKTRQDWIREAQTVCNAYIRLRDADLPCISCGRHHQGQYHAGHYRTTKAAPELRFHEFNLAKQCQPCNNHLSGNITEYRINLVKKIGIKNVEWLEGPHQPQKYTINDLQEIIIYYREQIKYLKESHGSECC